MTMKIDTFPILLPGVKLPKGKRHLVAEKSAYQGALPIPVKGTWEDLVASGREHENVTDYETEERLAIRDELQLAVRQTIDQATMIAGLLKAARWPR